MIRCDQTQIAMIRAAALRPQALGASCAEPYRGHPRNGLLPAAIRSGVGRVLEMPKYRRNKTLFKNKYLFVIPALADLRSQIAISNAGHSDAAALEMAEPQLAGKGTGKKK